MIHRFLTYLKMWKISGIKFAGIYIDIYVYCVIEKFLASIYIGVRKVSGNQGDSKS